MPAADNVAGRTQSLAGCTRNLAGRTRSLAGTNGIPRHDERVYLHVISETSERGEIRPTTVIWPDGRRFEIASSMVLRRFGRWELGTLCVCYEVTITRRSRPNVRRVIWWERGRWFARRR